MKFIRLFWKPPEPSLPIEPGDYIAHINYERVQQVVKSECLEEQAQEHADWMLQHRTMSHRGFDRRLEACDMYGGENVAWGQTSLAEVIQVWMQSSGHRRNMLNPGYREAGYAVAGTYHCLLLGKSRRAFLGITGLRSTNELVTTPAWSISYMRTEPLQ